MSASNHGGKNENIGESIFEYAPIGIAVIAKNGILESVNSKFLEIHGGKSKDEFIGLDALATPFYKESGLDSFISQVLGGQQFDTQISFTTLAGAKESLRRYIGIPIFETDNKTVQAALLMVQDLTNEKRMESDIQDYLAKLKQEQSRFLASINSLSLGFIVVDIKNNLLIKNKAADYILGLPHLEGEIFLRGDILEIEERLKNQFDLRASFEKCIREKQIINAKDVKLDNKFLRLFLAPIILAKGQEEVMGVVILIEDVTEQKMIDKMRTEIVSITSHQLRTPLSIVKGNLEMVLDGDFGKVEEKQKEVLNDAFLGNERMISLVNNLMDVSKIEQGELSLQLGAIQLENVVNETVNDLKLFAQKRGVTLSYEVPANPLPKVMADSQKLKQALTNLIDNSIKYSPKGRVEIKIEAEADKFLKVVVKDNGAGIPEDEQEKIFDRFFRASNITKLDPGGGTGMGLYIVKSIIKQLGGKLWFESAGNGKGTTFYFTVPLA